MEIKIISKLIINSIEDQGGKSRAEVTLRVLAYFRQFAVGWPLLAVISPRSCSLPLLNRTEGENKMKKLVGQGKN